MLNNKDLELLNNLANMLRELDLKKNDEETIKEVLYYIVANIDKIVLKVINNKKEYSNRTNNYNKRNKKYHSLVNSLSYHRKKGNGSKVREIEEKLKNLKKSSTI